MNNRQNCKGQAMIAVFIYITVVCLIAVYITTYSVNLHRLVIKEVNHTRAYYAAEAGVIRRMTECYNGGAGSSDYTLRFPDLTLIPAGSNPSLDNIQCDVRITTTAMTLPDTYRITVRVSNWYMQ